MRGNLTGAIAIAIAIAFALALACVATHGVAQTVGAAESSASTLAGKPAKKFSTAGHTTAKDVDLTIKYPADWRAESDPNVVQKFVSPTGTAVVLISTDTIPGEPLSQKEMSDVLTDRKRVVQMVTSNSKALDFKFTKLEGKPAAIVEHLDSREHAGVQVNAHVLCIVFFRGNSVVMVHGMVGGPNKDAEAVSKDFESHRDLFTQMFSSIVFNDKERK